MHISVFMGPASFGASSDLAKIELCLDLAAKCAEQGYAMVTFGEQHYNGYEPYSNPFLMAARLSTALGQTWFGTTVVPLAFHNPLRLAEESNIVDLLLRGRFVLGLSQGRTGPVPDWKNFGIDQADREAVFASKLGFLRRAAAQKAGEPPIVMDTNWDTGELNGRMMPLSWRKGGAQLAIGSGTVETIDEIGHLGLPLFMSPARLSIATTQLARHRVALDESRAPASRIAQASRLTMITLFCVVGESDDEAWQNSEALMGMNPMMDRSVDKRSLRELAAVDEESITTGADPFPRNANYARSWLLVGSPETVAARLTEYEAAGFEHVNVRFTAGLARPDLVYRSFDLFSQHVLPLIGHELFPAVAADEVEEEHTNPAPTGPSTVAHGPGGGDFASRNVPAAAR